MHITRVEITATMAAPRERPIRDALQTLSGGGTVQVTLHTDTGLTGEGSAGFGRIPGAVRTLQVLIDEELAPLVRGRDPFCVRQIHEDLLRETEYHGSAGLAMFGIAALDVALWDLVGKAAGVS